MSIKAPDYQGILAPNADQFQKQFSIYIKVLPRYLQTWSKWEADHLMQVLWKTDPQICLGSKIYP